MIDLLQMQHALAHDPCRRSDRSPVGAVTVGEAVTLVLRVEECARHDIDRVFLEFVNDPPVSEGEESPEFIWRQIPMSECADGYTACINTHGSTRIIFYRFRVCTALSDILYIKRSDDFSTTGMSCLPGIWLDEMDPSSAFQLTVFEPGFNTPEWMHGATMYQIFPDRFSRDSQGVRYEGVASHESRGWPIKVHEDWNEAPDWIEPYEPVDFYGGTLRGIAERIDYIKSLGVDVIYLNPICESRSNHRYNTGDYKRVDPILGTWDELRDLSEKARELGIRIVLDTVLSHTGASSLYFNADGSYDSLGAAQSVDSPYRQWYDFTPNEFAPYRCWWNDITLPEIEECDLSWQHFMLGDVEGPKTDASSVEDGALGDTGDDGDNVLAMWAKNGAQGYRLDVADEIPDNVLELIRASVKSTDEDAAIIGEVWEDPTTKTSYGGRRTYALGRALDSVMNYPLRSQLIEFALGRRSAVELSTFLRLQKSNYPKPLYDSLMNLLSSHDVERIRSVLAAGFEFRELSRDEQVEIVSAIDGGADWKASILQRILAMITYMLPGMPCLYYGDERGMQGGRDPFCRATFPWDGPRYDCGEDLTAYYQALGKFRSASMALRKGTVTFSHYREDVICIVRIFVRDDGTFEGMLCVVNRSEEQVRVAVDLANEATGLNPEDIIALRLRSTKFPRLVFSTDSENMSHDSHATLEDGIFIGEIGPLRAGIFQISPGFGKLIPRGSGIVCHLTSVPNSDGGEANKAPGTLGEPAREFIDALSASGIKYWQMLPVNPTDEYGSPYAGLSAFAGNIDLVEGDIGPEEVEEALRNPEYGQFYEHNKEWLERYAAYSALKAHFDGSPWWEWPERYRRWDPSLIEDELIAERFAEECANQFMFQRQWDALRDYAASEGVSIIGDMPFYVSADSADVWSNPECFSVDESGNIVEEGGVPPDQFATDGQLWGVPTYNWDALKGHRYDWWIQRFNRLFELFDYVRIDHFLGFSAYYAIEQGKSAVEGRWIPGPGLDLFREAYEQLGPLPVIAEDLGLVTAEVRQLLAQTAFPGMDVLQFFDGDPLEYWRPRYGRVVYTSTHDTSTLAGWALDRYHGGADDDDSKANARDIAKKLSYKVLDSKADIVMFSLQDVIRLGNEARMNVPGTTEGNWKWQATPENLRDAHPFMRRIASRRM